MWNYWCRIFKFARFFKSYYDKPYIHFHVSNKFKRKNFSTCGNYCKYQYIFWMKTQETFDRTLTPQQTFGQLFCMKTSHHFIFYCFQAWSILVVPNCLSYNAIYLQTYSHNLLLCCLLKQQLSQCYEIFYPSSLYNEIFRYLI